MGFSFEQTVLDTPFVERVWRTQNEVAGTFTSLAATRWEMVITRYNGQTSLTVRGPETKATTAFCPPDAEFFGIVFKPGAYMPHLPVATILHHKEVTLSLAGKNSFWLHGSVWPLPAYHNVDTFLEQMVRQGLLVRDNVVEKILQNQRHDWSARTVRRHFQHATGLTPGTLKQIERARQALLLLKEGVSILDTVEQTGYFDQPHLTRALKHFTGQTPAQIAGNNLPMSLLYKTGDGK